MNLDVKKYLLLLFVSFSFTTNTNGLKVRKNRGKNVNVINDLSNILKKFYAESSVVDDSGFKKKLTRPERIEDYKRKAKQNVILVKRLVPSNYESKGYEYDNVFKTLYRPLVRLNKKNKKVTFINHEKLNKLSKQTDNFEIIERPHRDLIIPEDGYLRQPFKTNLKENEEEKILKEVKNYVKHHDPIKVLQLKDSILRSMREKEYIVNYIINGNNNYTTEHVIKTHLRPEHKLQQGQPYYGYWHYWTYGRDILQDNCKGTAVQYGNICIQTPEH